MEASRSERRQLSQSLKDFCEMPNISLIRSHLFEAIGKQYTDKEFDELCFEFGVEVDDVATEIIEVDILDSNLFNDLLISLHDQFTGIGTKEEHVIYIIAIPANRYDLLCMEGFARAIRIFIGVEKAPVYQALDAARSNLVMHVESSTESIRPFVVCGVLRGVKFDAKIYKSFIDLQEKLHQNICRKRSYVAIGTHDLDTIEGPFTYRALNPTEINFVPLTEDNGKSYNGKELLDFYREDSSVKHLKPYTELIYNSPVYPVIHDKNGKVLSLPPIINSKHSRIQMHTTNIFIECTGTDLTKANIVLDTVITMFSQHCSTPFTCEKVDVIYENGKKQTTPLLSQRTCDALVTEINGTIGIELTPPEMCTLCERMQLGPVSYLSESDTIRVTVPPTRSDILHPVDVIEDIAIAYGYNNIPTCIPQTLTVGSALPINQFTDLLRTEIASAGYVEMLTHGLCSLAENFTDLRRPVGPAVSLSNPANVEYEVVRTTLLPGALKTLAFNKSISHKDGVKLFEISDVVIPYNNEVGALNIRHLVAIHASNSSGFEIIHGMADRIMTLVQIKAEKGYAAMSLSEDEISDRARVARHGVEYYLKPGADPCFFDGMSADIVLRKLGEGGEWTETVIGSLGTVHPDVLRKYDVVYPCAAVELDVEAIM
eukprot:gene7658-15673_t